MIELQARCDERRNDHHTTLAQTRTARAQAAK
jgi:hypothetical protein